MSRLHRRLVSLLQGRCCNGQGIIASESGLTVVSNTGTTPWYLQTGVPRSAQRKHLSSSDQQQVGQQGPYWKGSKQPLKKQCICTVLLLKPHCSCNLSKASITHNSSKQPTLHTQQRFVAQHPSLCITIQTPRTMAAVQAVPPPCNPLPYHPSPPPHPPTPRRCRAQGQCVCPVVSWTSPPTRTCSSQRGWMWTGRAPHEQHQAAAAAASSKR